MKFPILTPLMLSFLVGGIAQADNPACIDACAIAFANKNYPVALQECTAAAE